MVMALLAALSATCFILSVLLLAVVLYVGIDTRPLEKVPQLKLVASTLASFVIEAPLLVIATNVAQIFIVWLFGGFRYTLSHIAYYLNFILILLLIVVWGGAYETKNIVEKALVAFTPEKESFEFPGLMSGIFWDKHTNFFYTPRDVTSFSGITYATYEETAESVRITDDYTQPRNMMLDIYKHIDVPTDGKRPVLIYIHGGAWRRGSRKRVPPLLFTLVEQSKWILVSIDYRLVPKNKYPVPLQDCKRAIRWVKQNILAFGGDPDFIYTCGDSSGGHMAVMCALTPSLASLQVNFPDFDTSVRGVVSLNGILNVHEPREMMEWFWKEVCQMKTRDGNGNVDAIFVKEHSPLGRVEDAAKKESTQKCCPVLVVVGTHDTISSSDVGNAWVEAARKAYESTPTSANTLSDYQLLSIPGMHHSAPLFSSIRNHYTGLGIDRWLNYIYDKQKKEL